MSENRPVNEARIEHAATLVRDMDLIIEEERGLIFSLAEQAGGEVFDAIWRNAPTLPGASQLEATGRMAGSAAAINLFVQHEPFRSTYTSLEMAKMLSIKLWPTGSADTTYGSSAASATFAAMANTFSSGKYSEVSGKLINAASNLDPTSLTLATPILCMHSVNAAVAQAVQSQVPNPNQSDIGIYSRQLINDRVRQACIEIQRNTVPSFKDIPGPVGKAAQGACKVLYECYYMSNDLADAAVRALIPFYVSPDVFQLARPDVRESIRPPYVLRRAGVIRDELVAYGVTAARDMSLDVDSLMESVRSASENPTQTLTGLNMLHATLRISYYTRALVDGLAEGRYSYIDLMAYQAEIESTLYGGFMADRAEVAKNRRDAAEAAERARLEDAGWMVAELDLDADGEVNIKFLRPAPKATDTEQTSREVGEAQQAVSRVEKHRLLTLALLKQMMPGSQTYFRLLKKRDHTPLKAAGTEPKAEPTIDPEEVDGYIILVNPQGDAVGECLNRGATFVFRHETGEQAQDPYDWMTVFDDDKDHAAAHGAVRFQHPSRKELGVDMSGTVKKYVDVIATELLWDLRPGEQLPEPRVLRRIGKSALEIVAMLLR